MSRISHASQAEVIRSIRGSFLTSNSNIVRLGRRIGIGAEGEVFEIQDSGDLVAKIYHEPPPPEKAEKLVALSRLGNDRLFNLSAWPVDVLCDATGGKVAGFGGEIAGFVMKKISGAEEVHALHSPKSRLQKFPEASWSFLIYVAANIARAVAAIHEHGFVIGDLNPKNILVTRMATVYLLDVDSFQVSVDGKTYRCDGGFAEYTPPELQGVAFRDVDRTQEHDCFGLAIVIFQLLFLGRHPFSGRYLGAGEMPLERAIRESRFAYGADAEAREMRQPPGALALDSMPSSLVDLFRRAFLTNDRPKAREWIALLDALAKSLKRCALHSGHYFYKELRECPWCGLETHARVRLFNSMLPGGDSRRGYFRLDEIWDEIFRAEPPDTPMILWDKILKAPKPSADVEAAVRKRRIDLLGAIAISASLSFIVSVLISPPLSLFLFVALAIVAKELSENMQIDFGKLLEFGKLQTLFQSQQPPATNPLSQEVQSRLRLSEEKARRVQEQYDRDAGNQRWGAKREELLNNKATYENLAKIRQLRLQELEADTSKKGVLPETRINVEKEVTALRFRLECELSAGAQSLRRLREEIEGARRILKPELLAARQELAQAEKDLKLANRRYPFAPVLIALFTAFSIGTSLKYDTRRNSGYNEPPKIERQAAPAGQSEKADALRLYDEGVWLLNNGKFEDAIKVLRNALKIDPTLGVAYEPLGHALYRLGKYEDSIAASKRAIAVNGDFMPYYNLGRAHMARQEWYEASDAFERAITYCKQYDWIEDYSRAYYYRGLSQAWLGTAEIAIESLKNELADNPPAPLKRFELATLYLGSGRYKDAMSQYKILIKLNPTLAEELRKLIEKYAARKPA